MSKRKLTTAASTATLAADLPALSTEQDRHAFATKLRDFHCARKTPFLHAPMVLGKCVDFLRLYNTVLSLGGYRRVSEAEDWYQVLESMGLYKYCANAELAIRQIYLRYLEPYERHQQHRDDKDSSSAGLVRNYDEDSNDGESSLSRFKRSQSFSAAQEATGLTAATGPAGSGLSADAGVAANTTGVYNIQNHILPAHMREQWGLSCDLVDAIELSALEKALLCGLPNEVDFAINACLLMSYQPGGFQLQSNPRILELLAAHAGVFDCGPRSYFPLMEEWFSQNKVNMLRFWYESVWDSELRNLLSPDWLADETPKADSSIVMPEAQPAWRLMNLTPDLGLRDLPGQRLILIATTLRNLVLEDRPNAVAVTRSPPALRLLLLCSASRHAVLQHLALDALASMPVVLHSTRLSWALRLLLSRCLSSPDRQLIVRGLELICCLAGQPENWQQLQSDADFLPADLPDSLAAWLLLKDLQLMLAALEATHRLSAVGGDCSVRLCSPSPELLRVLISLLTFEASQVGSAGIVGIKIFQGPGASGGPAAPASATAAGAAAKAAAQAASAVSFDCGMPPPPPPPQVALVRQQQQQQTPMPNSNHIQHQNQNHHHHHQQQQQPPSLRDYILWWLRSRRVAPGPHRLPLLHTDCGRAFAAQFNGAPFLPFPDFCALLGELGFTAAVEPLPNGLVPQLAQTVPTTILDNETKKVLDDSSPTKKKLTGKQKQTPESQQQQQQQRQPRRRNSCSSVSSSDDSSSAAAASAVGGNAVPGGGVAGRLMTAAEPQAATRADSAAAVAAAAAVSAPANSDTAAAIGHEAVIERVLNHLRPGDTVAKAKLQQQQQQQQQQQLMVNGHHHHHPAAPNQLPNGVTVSIMPNGHETPQTPSPPPQQQPQQQSQPPQQQLIRIVGPPSTSQQPPLGLLCEWDGCWHCSDTPARVLHHVYTHHLCSDGNAAAPARCLWRGCDPSLRGAYSLLAHVQESHCSERALRASLQRRRAVALSPSSAAAAADSPGGLASAPPQSSMLRLPEDAARHAIHRLAARDVVSSVGNAASPGGGASGSREGPVTKHIRLTAALALRNLLRHAQPARLFVSGYADSLAEICLSGSEAGLIIGQCVGDLV